jgi:hypothetical protein
MQFQQTWEHSSIQPSQSSTSFTSYHQPGGTLTAVVDRWISHITTKGVDPFGLGRWSFVTLQDKANTLIPLVSAYRVCQKAPSAGGVKTAYMQQYPLLLDKLSKNRSTLSPEPNQQFLWDLQSWLQHLQHNGHQIILNIDNNEDLYMHAGSLHPLPYNPDLIHQHKTHDASLHTLSNTCGLINSLGVCHSDRPFHPTYIRGEKRIDFMLVPASLQNSVIGSGILPYNTIFHGDHRPCFLDFDADQLFAGDTPPLAPPCCRSLQLHDPRLVTKYKEVLHHQLEYHRILDRVQELEKAAQQNSWMPQHTQDYEDLDTIITKSMLTAEKSAGKKYTK